MSISNVIGGVYKDTSNIMAVVDGVYKQITSVWAVVNSAYVKIWSKGGFEHSYVALGSYYASSSFTAKAYSTSGSTTSIGTMGTTASISPNGLYMVDNNGKYAKYNTSSKSWTIYTPTATPQSLLPTESGNTLKIGYFRTPYGMFYDNTTYSTQCYVDDNGYVYMVYYYYTGSGSYVHFPTNEYIVNIAKFTFNTSTTTYTFTDYTICSVYPPTWNYATYKQGTPYVYPTANMNMFGVYFDGTSIYSGSSSDTYYRGWALYLFNWDSSEGTTLASDYKYSTKRYICGFELSEDLKYVAYSYGGASLQPTNVLCSLNGIKATQIGSATSALSSGSTLCDPHIDTTNNKVYFIGSSVIDSYSFTSSSLTSITSLSSGVSNVTMYYEKGTLYGYGIYGAATLYKYTFSLDSNKGITAISSTSTSVSINRSLMICKEGRF